MQIPIGNQSHSLGLHLLGICLMQEHEHEQEQAHRERMQRKREAAARRKARAIAEEQQAKAQRDHIDSLFRHITTTAQPAVLDLNSLFRHFLTTAPETAALKRNSTTPNVANNVPTIRVANEAELIHWLRAKCNAFIDERGRATVEPLARCSRKSRDDSIPTRADIERDPAASLFTYWCKITPNQSNKESLMLMEPLTQQQVRVQYEEETTSHSNKGDTKSCHEQTRDKVTESLREHIRTKLKEAESKAAYVGGDETPLPHNFTKILDNGVVWKCCFVFPSGGDVISPQVRLLLPNGPHLTYRLQVAHPSTGSLDIVALPANLDPSKIETVFEAEKGLLIVTIPRFVSRQNFVGDGQIPIIAVSSDDKTKTKSNPVCTPAPVEVKRPVVTVTPDETPADVCRKLWQSGGPWSNAPGKTFACQYAKLIAEKFPHLAVHQEPAPVVVQKTTVPSIKPTEVTAPDSITQKSTVDMCSDIGKQETQPLPNTNTTIQSAVPSGATTITNVVDVVCVQQQSRPNQSD